MDKESDQPDRDEGVAEDRRTQSERRGETRRRNPRYTPDGAKPDRRSGDRRRDGDPVD